MSTDSRLNIYPEEFADIAPYSESEYKERIALLSKEPGFEHAVRYIMPDVDYPEFVKGLLATETQSEFQYGVMGQFLESLAARTTNGITVDGLEYVTPGKSFTFISNHRDIVLDASFLNLCFIRRRLPITQIAIGNNLLIYEWIRELVKINRSFIVKRDVPRLQALEAARQLSRYIHYVVGTRNESVWIAQREGRAKDSNDVTQESLLKMLAMGGEGVDTRESLMEINLVPVSISYEFDPNDYLKVREFLLKRRDVDFKKSQHDDLHSMETGMLKNKGRVHFQINRPINETLKDTTVTNRLEVIRLTREAIDNEIHSGYRFYPINYIAYDRLNNTERFADKYNQADIDSVNAYFDKQMASIDVPDMTDEERQYAAEMFLMMYANPLTNKLAAESK